MADSVIAIVFDFDETLGPDTISLFLKSQGINLSKFWSEIDEMVKDGWDPPLAYMTRMLDLSKDGKLDLSRKNLAKIGKQVKLFPGLPNAIRELKEFVTRDPNLKSDHITLEFYVISGGLEEMVRATKIEPFIDGIFGCNFSYDKSGNAASIKSTISFTEKTRFIHGIRKGVSVNDLRSNPYRVNDAIPKEDQRIPFAQMIYIGDGPSDIPCLSSITSGGGMGIGVSQDTFKKGYELARGRRITVGPYSANYKKGSDMRKFLEESLLHIGLEISVNKRKNVVGTPTH